MKLRRKLFGRTTDRLTEDKPVARETGRVLGSALIGSGAGLLALGGAENSGKIVEGGEKLARKAVERVDLRKWNRVSNKYKKALGDNFEKDLRYNEEVNKIINKNSIKSGKISKAGEKLKRVTEPVTKFAKTKGGKVALIGAPTAVIGGAIYKSSKKKDKKNRGEK